MYPLALIISGLWCCSLYFFGSRLVGVIVGFGVSFFRFVVFFGWSLGIVGLGLLVRLSSLFAFGF